MTEGEIDGNRNLKCVVEFLSDSLTLILVQEWNCQVKVYFYMSHVFTYTAEKSPECFSPATRGRREKTGKIDSCGGGCAIAPWGPES